ncbi:penicillin-insensitive murein endopeptidase [Kaistia algarum]|uniref:penicillin-insensitive murein endopeptidase n=1 Tax=Kaistia algarum TaxID=2083279 RepID=UPI000CE7CBE3|nr:penicillin-insensitive murein endopeptidase [Kaistia algarum]MCX5513018.1 penicillin-insensitive murein endopeptidase [Kaistia algarum]PPE82012.1 penicillin-insensitive murein endopeptidase [Kaistia algarum]
MTGMIARRIGTLLLGFSFVGPALADPIDTTPAKILFSQMNTPIPLEARSIGSYAKGCLAGAVALPVSGPDWQAMRLSRNRNWGTPELVAFTEDLAAKSKKLDSWPGLLVGDMGQPRGGPALTGHASHQIGLDVDIWLTPMPKRLLSADERETMAPVNMVNEKARTINAAGWTSGQFRLIRRAALDPHVARIFVNPAIKKQLCVSAGADRAWLGKVRPWWGHTYHFHVRLDCPADMASCVPQKAPPAGDGCGAELDAWLQPPKPVKPTKPTKPAVKPRPLMLTDLPAACREVLLGAPPGIKPQPTLAISAPRSAPVQAADTSADDATENPVDAAVPPQRPNGTLY